MHYFPGLDHERILWEVTYTNLSMYLATVPSYESDEAETKQQPGTKETAVEQKQKDELRNFFKNT